MTIFMPFMTFCDTLYAYALHTGLYCLFSTLETLRPLHVLHPTLQPSLGSLCHLQPSMTATLVDES